MENNTANKNGFFSMLYRTRIQVTKGETTILNLSVLFSIISLLCAPWLVVIGAIVALVLGYRFAISRNAEGFSGDLEHVVRDAADTVKRAVENVTGSHEGDGQNGQNQDGDAQL